MNHFLQTFGGGRSTGEQVLLELLTPAGSSLDALQDLEVPALIVLQLEIIIVF